MIGLGQSMGGSLLVAQQARHRTFDGIGVLGYSAVHTQMPARPGSTPYVMPWMPRDARHDDATAMLNAAAVLEGGYHDDLPLLIDAFLTAWDKASKASA